ncbi:hypothetical protein DBR12_17145 [Acidovorax sp. HMWF029]|uniref:hypothetical protein n=1 Tax=Acidovorax sp. HMWF029 TaxID=2056863 RepID=UPI000D3A3CEE|nr:hypothetical protein [Acidovorax sp. HMWF029]PTT17809.1 hypothetical protein DBR12_17145 [Acidovorax sp. HMWF029]
MAVFTLNERLKYTALFIALGALAGCGATPRLIVEPEYKPLELVYLQPEYPVARMWPSAEYVARTEDEWERVWNEGTVMDPRDENVPRHGRPVVDFNQYMVIGISRGHGYSGCHGLYFRDIVERANFIEVQFVHRQPDETVSTQVAGTACTAMGVFLARWVRVPKMEKPVRFFGG